MNKIINKIRIIFSFKNRLLFLKNLKLKKENKKFSLEEVRKKYKKRQKNIYLKGKNKILTVGNIFIFILVISIIIYLNIEKYSIRSLYISIFLLIGIMLYMLIIDKFNERKKIEEKIENIKNENEKKEEEFLEKVKKLEEIRKNNIQTIILKNDEGYDVKVWNINRKTSLLIGKNTVRKKVDIDMSDAIYSNLISRVHGVLNRINGIWYYEDLNSQNGSGIEKKEDNRKIKIKSNVPIKVEKGDIIYLATTKILLK